MANKIGVYEVTPIDKKGIKGKSGEVISRIADEKELLMDDFFVKKCLKACKLKDKPLTFAIRFIKEMKGL